MNIQKFRGVLAERGISREFIAHAINVNPSTLYRKIAAGGDTFTIGEVQKIVRSIPLTKEEAIDIFLN